MNLPSIPNPHSIHFLFLLQSVINLNYHLLKMSNEIPNNLEIEGQDINSRIFERFVEILEFNDQHPEDDWRAIPDLAYINIKDENEKSTLKAIDLRNYRWNEGLLLHVLYIPSEISFEAMKNIQIEECKLSIYLVDDSSRENILRNLYENLYGEIGNITSAEDIDDATKEEINDLMERTLKLLPPILY